MNISELIKDLDKDLNVTETKRIENTIYITCNMDTEKCECTFCDEISSSIHSKYVRTISDLPIQNNEVKLLLVTRKFFCLNPNCEHKTFGERFNFVEPKAVRTNRLAEKINSIGLRDNSMDAVKTLKESGINVSSNTVLRIVKKKESISIAYETENIGIDDFSSKKREIYNSIIVDNDKHKKIEIINSREKDDVVKILKLFTNVKTVTRDFSLTYKNAISEALPQAKQIVDRFHIFKNLTDDLCNYLKRTVGDRIKLIKDETTNSKEILTKRQQNKIATANRKWEIAKEAKRLYQEGETKTNIAKKLGITRVTLNNYLSLKEPPVKDSDCILDDYIPLIKQLIIEGKKTKEIYQAMKEKGYKGKMTVLNMHMKSIRNEVKNNTSYLKRSKLKKLFFYDLKDIKNADLKNDIIFYLDQNKELKKIIDLKKEFKTIIFSKKPKKLDSWIKKAKLLNVTELNSFVNLIEGDIDAVKNAIAYDYSNGLTEGFNNKTKVIKRQMYGRCKFDLLRLKILA